VRAPFALQRYLEDLRDRTAWAPDYPLEHCRGEVVPREALHRIAHLWSLALLDDRFEELLLPVLVSELPLLDHLDRQNGERGWSLSREFFEERLASGACLLLLDGLDCPEWRRNLRFRSQ
jgi:hypothetical protein